MTKGNGLPCKKCGTAEWDTQGGCRACKRKSNRRWREAHPEKARESVSRYQKENPHKKREGDRRYYQKNREEIRERRRLENQANPDKNRNRVRQWELRNPEKAKENLKRWKSANKDKVSADTNRRRARKAQAGGSYTAAQWRALCEQCDYTCLRCGRREPEIKLTFDHVLPVSKGGSSDISNGQPLCLSCNSWKGSRHIDYRTKLGMLRWIQKKLFG